MKLDNVVKFAFPDWQIAMLRLTVVYRILECDDKIPVNTKGTDYEFIEEVLDDMHNRGLLDISIDDQFYVATDKATELRSKLVEAYDHQLKFEIFGDVNVAQDLPDDIVDEEGGVLDHAYDPRFKVPATPVDRERLGTTDMRIAMMQWLSELAEEEDEAEKAEAVDPLIIVFMQWLCDGKLKADDIWFDLKIGTFFKEVQEIVEGSYKWEDTAEKEDEAWDLMELIYKAGILEQRKRDGFECSACGIPLGVFEMNKKLDDEELTHCPNPECGASYEPPAPPLYECPKCDTEIQKGQQSCSGCGSEIDFNLPEGTVSQETETVTEETTEYEEAWGCGYGYYGYSPYGYYNPYDPMIDALVFCAAVDMLYY